jgi:hypothetical protein
VNGALSIGQLVPASRLARFHAIVGPDAGDAVFKPTFSGGSAIGGADADLIVDRCLIEVKATINPGKIGKASWPWQLLGYALLDLDNRYELSELALYLARQGLLLRWPIDEYASRASPGCRPLSRQYDANFETCLRTKAPHELVLVRFGPDNRVTGF